MIETEPIGQEQSAPATTPGALPALDFLITLARHWRFILRCTLGTAIVTTIVVLLLPNWYTAETIVLPPQQTSMSTALMGQLTGSSALATLAGASLGIKNPGELYAALFRSQAVEDAVIRRFGLQAHYHQKTMVETRKKFEWYTSVVLGPRDGLIRITVEDRDPKLAAAIANGYVQEFRKLSESLAITEAAQRRLFFEQQLSDAKDKLSAAEVAMKNTEQSTGVLQIDSQARALIETAAVLRAQVVAKQVQIQAMRTFATNDNPQLVQAQQQLVALQSQLAKLAGAGKDPDSGLLVTKGRIPQAAMEYVRRLRDVKYYEALFEQIAKQLEIARLDEAREGAVIQVADPAVPPDKKSSPHRAIILILMTLLALSGSIYWVRARERWALAMTDPEQLAKFETLRHALSRKR